MVRDHNRLHAKLDDEEMNRAGSVVYRGAAIGAAWWGLYGGAAALGLYRFSPLYRSFTIQFKVFIQLSFMTLGSMLEADSRLRAHEFQVRREKRLARDAEIWRRFEEDYEEKGTPGVGGEGRVSRIERR